MNLYVVHDMLAEESGPVFESKTDATAVRAFRRGFEKLPAGEAREFRLLRLGTIDHATNQMTLELHPVEVFVPAESEVSK